MEKQSNTKRTFKFTYNIALALIVIGLFVTIGLVKRTFFSAAYIAETVKQVIEIGMMVLPATLIIISGGIDFSMSSTLILSAIIGSIVARYTNSVLGVVACLLVGGACGVINGILIAKLKLPPLVSTLATMFLFKGIAEGITMGITSVGASVGSFPAADFLGIGTILGIPAQFFLIAILGIGFHILLSKTCFGRYIYAIGLNDGAAGYCGIKVERVKMLLYIIGGIVCSLTGLVFLGRFSSLRYDSADPLILQVITTVILGGTSIVGGSGNIKGSILAIAIIGILKSGMNVLFIPQTTQKIVLGLILLASLMVFQIIREKSELQRTKAKRLATSL